MDRRIAELGQKRKPADMVFVAVAEDQRVDGRDGGYIRQATGRRALAKIKQQPFALDLQGKAGRPFFADPGNKPQHRPIPIHDCFKPIRRAFASQD